MTNQEFKEIRDSFNSICSTTLFRKEKEYSDGIDRLCQFKQVAAFTGITPSQALAGMMVKHESSIHQMIWNASDVRLAIWQEKIGDLRNYLDLLYAIIVEDQEESDI
jgi:hypothetical protein